MGQLKLTKEKEKKEKEKEEEKTIGYAVVDLQPVLGLTWPWLGLGWSLTDLVNKHLDK